MDSDICNNKLYNTNKKKIPEQIPLQHNASNNLKSNMHK